MDAKEDTDASVKTEDNATTNTGTETAQPSNSSDDDDATNDIIGGADMLADAGEEQPWETQECKTLYRVYCTVRSMLDNRGYTLIETGLPGADADLERLVDPVEDVEKFFHATQGNTGEVERAKMRIEASRGNPHNETEQEKAVVHFVEKIVGTDLIRKLENEARNAANISRVIVVSPQKTSSTLRQIEVINHNDQRAAYFEHFKERELLMDITQHVLVPNHTVLTPAETKELLDRYKIDTYQLPKIRHEDAVARYFGLMPGQVVKISRCVRVLSFACSFDICLPCCDQQAIPSRLSLLRAGPVRQQENMSPIECALSTQLSK